ncbi:YIP1 family protein [Roseivivax sp. GX 12232]|uniref:YIP1 family protein n=1 Tax=Roseivivax sp. GX 12232 TaxID=2900547 RepID=UPI001E2DA8EA|nr:YIP1 family protein [Roseivivax sp. GX 12232]
MAVSTDILASYRGPGAVFRRRLAAGPREDRALALLMAACLLYFLSRLPALARQAHLAGEELNPLLGGALFGWIFIAPLVFYGLAALSHIVLRALGGRGSWYGARLALFWSLLAASPLVLLNGLVAGFIAEGPALTLVGLLWIGVFLWFWITGLKVAEYGEAVA